MDTIPKGSLSERMTAEAYGILESTPYLHPPEEWIEGALAELDAARKHTPAGAASRETQGGYAADAALLCRRSGIFPYYITALIAAGMRARYPHIADGELRNTIKAHCGLEREVQVITLIEDQYRSMGRPCIIPERLLLRRKAVEAGFRYEQVYGGCAQCTLAACFEALGKDAEPLFQSATILSGGGAVCTDGSCGSYSGALMVLGSVIGRSFKGMLADSDDEAYARANRMGQRLHEKYIRTYGDVRCAGVQECVFGRAFKLYDADEVKAFGAAGAHEEKCPSVVAAACSWTLEILDDEGLLSRVR